MQGNRVLSLIHLGWLKSVLLVDNFCCQLYSLKNHHPPVNVQVVHHMQGVPAACSPYEANAAKPSEAPSGPLLAVQGPYCRWGRIGFGTVDPSCLSPRHRVAHPPTVPLHVNPFIPNLPCQVLCPLHTDTCTGCPKKNALSEFSRICVGTNFFGYFCYFEQASLQPSN